MSHKKNILDKLGRNIEITFCESSKDCKAFFDGKLIGTFRFDEFNPDNGAVLLMTHCHLEAQPGFKQVGIGSAMIQLVNECGYTIWARAHDGHRRDDGSYLTEAAPAFVKAMVEKGLMHQEGSGAYEDSDPYDEE